MKIFAVFLMLENFLVAVVVVFIIAAVIVAVAIFVYASLRMHLFGRQRGGKKNLKRNFFCFFFVVFVSTQFTYLVSFFFCFISKTHTLTQSNNSYNNYDGNLNTRKTKKKEI